MPVQGLIYLKTCLVLKAKPLSLSHLLKRDQCSYVEMLTFFTTVIIPISF